MTQSETYQSAFSQLTGQAKPHAEPPETHEINSSLISGTDKAVQFVRKNSMSCPGGEKIAPQPRLSALGDHIADAQNLSKMELRRRYPREAASHKNMLDRRKSNGAQVHPAFLVFASFLEHVGPMPAKGATLDRIDNNDPEYAPGKVRWADKRTQNNNKSDTLIFYSSDTGKSVTVSQLAKLLSVLPDTIRKRRARGWSDDEIIAGKPTVRPSAVKAPVAPAGSLNSRFPEGLYSAEQLAMLNRPERMLTHARHISFHRDARDQQASREKDGLEYFPALYDELVESLCEDGNDPYGMKLPGVKEGVESTIAKLWHMTFKPHVVFDWLTPAQQQFVAKIDPEYVEKQKAKKG